MRRATVVVPTLLVLVLMLALGGFLLLSGKDPDPTAARSSAPGSAPPRNAEVPRRFLDRPARAQGRMVEVDYRTRHEGRRIDKRANVYLPAGYNRRTRYDVLYLMHGYGMNEESFWRAPLKNLLDHMIQEGRIRPTIVVTPTFYPDADRGTLHYAGELDRAFPRELERDLMPAVEGTYRTYARTTDAAGFRASRAHRAFGGFSMGAVTTWYAFIESLDSFKYFAPMAGDSWVIEDMGGASAPQPTAEYLRDVPRKSGYGSDDYLIAASVGTDDSVRYQVEPQIREMQKFPEVFDSANLRFTLDPDGEHNLEFVNKQLYNALPLFFAAGGR